MHDDHKHEDVTAEGTPAQAGCAPAPGPASAECCSRSAISAGSDDGRGFRVSGLDCAEEVSILRRALKPIVGSDDHLAFDVLNSRMIVLDGARHVPTETIVEAVAQTGMSAEPWSKGSAEAGHRREFARLKTFVGLSGAAWTAGIIYHVSQTGFSGLLTLFAGHGQVSVPWPEMILFLLAIAFGAWHFLPK